MTLVVKLAGRALPLLAVALAFGACDRVDPTAPADNPDPVAVLAAAPVASAFSRTFRGGIPFGVYHLPKEEYGKVLNGALTNPGPDRLLSYLEAARQSGTRLMVSLVGGERHYRHKDHSFSLTEWKRRVDRFRGIDLSSYIADGTVIGHYLIDEPHDKGNWGGTTISPATLDEMAKYSKQLWPSMATVVRSWPAYLKGHSYKYLDAAWAQYNGQTGATSQRLPIHQFMAKNVSEAKSAGLALVVGVNLLAGGGSQGLKGFYPGQRAPAASELKDLGSAMLDDSYPCAFISWKYDAGYMSRSDIQAALTYLSEKAQSRSHKSCRGAAGRDPDGAGEPPPPPPTNEGPGNEPPPPPVVEPPAPDGQPVAESIVLTVSGSVKASGSVKEKRRHMTLLWSGATGSALDVYRNGVLVKLTENDGRYVNALKIRGPITYAYKVCTKGTSTCSNVATVTFE